MFKTIDVEQYDHLGNKNINLLTYGNLTKTAAYEEYSQEIQSYINSIKPRQNYAYLLVAAMGDMNWGFNRNADGFPTESLASDSDEFGYKTFEKYAYWYYNHKNKDPKNSYGRVVFAWFNKRMSRVELIVEVDLEKDYLTKEDLENGSVIQVSMGCNINYDICVVCHPNWKEFFKIPEVDMIKIANSFSLSEIYEIGDRYGVELRYISKLNDTGGPVGISSVTEKYCEHMKYHKNKYLGSGQKVGVVNLRPLFFDISRVRVNADKSAFVLAKVAEEEEEIKSLTNAEVIKMIQEKVSIDKESAIDKNIDATVLTDDADDVLDYYENVMAPVLRGTEKPLPPEVLKRLSMMPMDTVMSSMGAMGMFPTPEEYQYLYLSSKGDQEIAEKLRSEGIVFNPEERTDVAATSPLTTDGVDDQVINELMPYASQKSYYPKQVVKRISITIKQASPMAINSYMTPQNVPSQYENMLGGVSAAYVVAQQSGLGALKNVASFMAMNKLRILGLLAGSNVAYSMLRYSGNEDQAERDFERNNRLNAMTAQKDPSIPLDPIPDTNSLMYPGQRKTAGFWSGMLKMVGIPMGAYSLSAYNQGRMDRGQNVGVVGKTIADHPTALALGGLAMGFKYPRQALGKMVGLGPKKIASMEKFASLRGAINMGIDISNENIDNYTPDEQIKLAAYLMDVALTRGMGNA